MKLKYGKEEIQLSLQDKNIIQILHSKKQEILLYPENKLKELLKNPINSSSLKDLVNRKKTQKILIVVNDITRPTPYEVILPSLLDELHQIGIKKENITFMVATGIHRSNSPEEIKEMFGENIFSVYQFMNHDCDDPHLKDLGNLKSGNKL
jgi:nickel-dependent lactate racemase